MLGAVLRVLHDLHAVSYDDALYLRAALDADALFAEIFRQAEADVAVFARQQLLGADQDRHGHAGTVEELAQLAADVAAAEHDEGARRRFQIERRVAVDVARLRETRHRRRHDAASGRDDEPRCVQDVVPDAKRRRRLEPCVAAEQWERLDPGDAVVRPALHEAALAFRERAEVELRLVRAYGELARRPDRVQQVARRDERLRRHAAAQDAQPAERTAIDERDVRAEIACRACGRVAAAARAHDDEIETIRNDAAPWLPREL